MKTVFNRRKNIDFTKQPMFFGEAQNIQRYDNYRYPIFDKLTQRQLSYFWRPEEVSLQKDRSDYQHFREEQKFIFTSNLKYQTMLDSVQGRGPALAFGPYCSLPELESCILTWDFFENIHSRSYTHIVKNVYPNPSEVFDTMLDDEKILARALTVTEAYDTFLKISDDHFVKNKGTLYDVKKHLLLAVVNVHALEALRFYVSFACSFAFGELKMMEGSAKIIGLIARDEALHLAITNNIIKNWQKGDDPEYVQIWEESKDEVYAIYDKVVKEEKEWADYMMSKGSIIGLNTTLLHQYIEVTANKRLRNLGLQPVYDISSSANPLPWMQHWIESKSVQVAPQETEVESYVIGGIKQDVKSDTFAGFKL